MTKSLSCVKKLLLKRNTNLQVGIGLEINVCNRKLYSMESVELILAEPAALFVAQRRGDLVSPEPSADARQVVLIDERQTVGLQGAAEVDGDDSVEIIFLDVVHQDSERTVVTVGGEVQRHFGVVKRERFHIQNLFWDSSAKE